MVITFQLVTNIRLSSSRVIDQPVLKISYHDTSPSNLPVYGR